MRALLWLTSNSCKEKRNDLLNTLVSYWDMIIKTRILPMDPDKWGVTSTCHYLWSSVNMIKWTGFIDLWQMFCPSKRWKMNLIVINQRNNTNRSVLTLNLSLKHNVVKDWSIIDKLSLKYYNNIDHKETFIKFCLFFFMIWRPPSLN